MTRISLRLELFSVLLMTSILPVSVATTVPAQASASPAFASDGSPASDVAGFRALPNGVEWSRGKDILRVTALSDDIVRVCIGRNGSLPEDASWAVLAGAREASVSVRGVTSSNNFGFATKLLTVTLSRATGGVTIADSEGRVLFADRSGPFAAVPDGNGFEMTKAIPGDAHYFGLGDKFGPLDRLGHSYAMWNTDSYAYSEGQDPLYKDIPFFIGFTKGTYFGMFLDNTWRTVFDFGHDDPAALRIRAANGPIDYYVMAGPTAKDVETQYARLTGTPAMQQRWMLGFQQSRWGYPTEKVLRGVVDHLRKDRIPSDAVWMDIDYQEKYRPFTVDSKTFPTFSKMVSDFTAQHMHTVAITDLHVADLPNAGYAPYDSGVAQDRFVKAADGKTYVAPVWPGAALFPDFTQAATRAWWGTLYKKFVQDGISGFWNDMDEPAIFETATKTMPLDNKHRIDEPGFASRVATHEEIHNIYGMQNHRATYEGVLALKPDERPFVMTRASYAGGQRYGVTWSGDNVSTWNHLALTVPMLESLGMGGFTFAGADIGGFAGVASPELLTKWYEIAMFTPIARSHADPTSRPQEPWADGKPAEDIRRRFIEARYRLLPYNYTLAEEASRTGVPMMRPLFMEFPHTLIDNAPMDLSADSEFMWGRSLLVAPASTPESPAAYDVTLPPGAWYDYWTGKKLSNLKTLTLWGTAGSIIKPKDDGANSPHVLTVNPRLDELPVFVRAGSIIPRQNLVQSTDETPSGPLELDVYPGPDCEGTVYSDDGHSMAFRKGSYSRVNFTCSLGENGVFSLAIAKQEGSMAPWWKSIAVTIHGIQGHPTHAIFNSHVEPVATKAHSDSLQVTLPYDGQGGTLTLQ
ncbi:TIM-barrel domain-containing protein [Nguyenibacter sp. L1]|uniref:glycoside hydrolase family 31 protein n=1 Tax=Nguyenibacter sp. L1 TaxID=3049350 RepID=UPI002B4A3AD4|nr:TIM-barrel domain-containing protein [Nguyenibacter sp. L1]WRH89791.1 glycoside hydrolase family 31 protein [Nguyenibacter sp. L1]